MPFDSGEDAGPQGDGTVFMKNYEGGKPESEIGEESGDGYYDAEAGEE